MCSLPHLFNIFRSIRDNRWWDLGWVTGLSVVDLDYISHGDEFFWANEFLDLEQRFIYFLLLLFFSYINIIIFVLISFFFIFYFVRVTSNLKRSIKPAGSTVELLGNNTAQDSILQNSTFVFNPLSICLKVCFITPPHKAIK